MEHPASGGGRAPVRSLLEWQRTLRRRGQHLRAGREGRPLDQGGFRHAVRRRDDRDEVSTMTALTRFIGIHVAVLAASALGACGSSESRLTATRQVTIYVSTDRVFSEPVLREYEKQSGVTVN